jgi:hypothetical protein
MLPGSLGINLLLERNNSALRLATSESEQAGVLVNCIPVEQYLIDQGALPDKMAREADLPREEEAAWFDTRVPENMLEFVFHLYCDFRSVGLFESLDLYQFSVRLCDKFSDWMDIEELLAQPSVDSLNVLLTRHSLLTTLQGLRHDWKFDAGDIVEFVADKLRNAGHPHDLKHSTERRLSDSQGVREIHMWVGDGARLTWRCSSIAGLMEGINRVLADAGSEMRFVGLYNGSDTYEFALVPSSTVGRLEASPLFELLEHEDPHAGPISN